MVVVGVSFDNDKKIHYFKNKNLDLKIGMNVIVKTERGNEFGKVELPSFEIDEKIKKQVLYDVIRIASKKDCTYYKNILADQEEALKKCRELANKMNLNMQIMDANFTFDKNQLLFRFISDERIDFRNLAKELANIYKTRIELRQIGVRDRAKEVGGCGLCGLTFCCCRFNSDFSSVSINMAKNQNISLNPNKINGVCGRLLCCLRYEDDMYKDYKKNFPKIGEMIDTPQGKGKVESIDPINNKIVVNIKEIGKVEIENGSN